MHIIFEVKIFNDEFNSNLALSIMKKLRWTPKFGPGAKLRLWWTGAAKKPNQNH